MKNTVAKIAFNIILILFALVTVIPFVWMFISSFATNGDIVSISDNLFPKPSTLDNYRNIQTTFNFMRFFSNSLFISVVKTGIVLYTSAVGGYIFSKLRYRGRKFLFGMILSTMMIPWAVTIIPQYEMMVNFGLLDSYWALILPGLVNGFGVFMLKQSMDDIPDEIIEAAKVDGAGDFRIFHQIVLPLSRNALSAIGIFVFLWNWEDYLWPFLMINTQEKQVLAVGLKLFNGQYGTDYGGLFAATTVAIVPVLVVYIFFQKCFIEGLAAGSGK